MSEKNFTYAKCLQLFAEEINRADFFCRLAFTQSTRIFNSHTYKQFVREEDKKCECKESKQILTSLCESGRVRVWEIRNETTKY